MSRAPDHGAPDSGVPRAPALVRWLTFLTLASSGLVMFEPAPTDLFLLLLVATGLLNGGFRWSGISGGVWFGLAVFAVGSVASLMAAVQPLSSARYLAITIYMLVLLVTLAAMTARYGRPYLRLCLRAFCTAALFAAIVGILARFHWIPNAEMFFLGEHALRVKSTFKDPNVFAPFLVAATLVVLNDYFTGERGLLGSSLLCSAYALGILFAFSRGAFLHLAVSLLTYAALCSTLVRNPQLVRRLFAGMTAGAAVLAMVLVFALASSGLEQFLGSRLAYQSYDNERFAMQRLAIQVAVENPIGIGPGEWSTTSSFANDPHNVYLRVLAENGVLGFAGWTLLLGACLARSLGAVLRRTEHAPVLVTCFAVLAGLLVESLFIDTLHWRHLFVFLGLPVGLAALARDTVASPATLDARPA